ncbi:MAG TPA: hypothetical protein VKT51_04560 [Candidatus Eremiobacteraceae bacterium]|nr:hypothetical protein [Candidatus Eremiobacteraceae bacterium]
MWEALTAIGSILSAIVIAVTVVMAARQVKITTDQLEQTRRATQFEAVRSVLLEMVDPKFVDAYRFVIQELSERLEDETFYREVGQIGVADDRVHKELYILRSLDRIGTYVKYGLVDGPVIYDSYAPRIILSWELLAEVVAIHRRIASVRLYRAAEYLYGDSKRWAESNEAGSDVVGSVKRMAEFAAGASRSTAPGELS